MTDISPSTKRACEVIIEYAKNNDFFQSWNLSRSYFDDDTTADDLSDALHLLVDNKVLNMHKEGFSTVYSLNKEISNE